MLAKHSTGFLSVHFTAINQTGVYKTAIAFDIIGLLVTIAALVLFLILIFTCKERERLFMIIIAVLAAVAREFSSTYFMQQKLELYNRIV